MTGERSQPPGGAPWDTPLDRAPLAFVDLEMTGLDLQRDRVVQICVERVEGGRVTDRLCSFVHCDRGPGPSVVHGITAPDLVGAPSYAALLPRVEELLEGACFVAHGARWDIAFLAAEHHRAGASFACEHFIDTLALSRRTLRRSRHRLADLAEAFGIENPSPHRADNDARVTRELLAVLVHRLEATCPRDLWRAAAGRREVMPEILAVAERAVASRKPVVVRYRPSGRGALELEVQLTAIRTDLDPPLVLGYLLHSRGRRELRADRILELRFAHETH
jgi:DNA polymerase III subunit epsilon